MIAAAMCFAGTVNPDIPDSEHVEYGKKFGYVARLVCENEESGVCHDASCVLISPMVAITAAHVVDGMDSWEIYTDDGVRHEVRSVIVHEDYVKGNFGEADIAICISSDAFGLAWYPPLYDGRDEAGRVASIAGFGATGTFTKGREKADGVRRAGSNVIDDVEGAYLTCSVGEGTATRLEFLLAPGDSGGGLFIGNSLAGVNSFVMVSGTEPPKGVLGEQSGHTRISDYKSWIEKETDCATTIRDGADRGRGLDEEEAK
jgi:hypothetical protein